MNQSVVIKPFRFIDAHAFAKLRREVEAESDQLVVKGGERKETAIHVIAKLLVSQRRTVTFIAYDRGAMIGYVNMVFPRYRRLQGNAYIAIIALKKKYRGQGIGSQLMDVAEAYAKERGVRRVELEVFGENTHAREMYERRGYTTEGVKKEAVVTTTGFDDIIIMAKRLK